MYTNAKLQESCAISLDRIVHVMFRKHNPVCCRLDGSGVGWTILFAKQSASLESFFKSFAIYLIVTVYSDVVSLSKAALLHQMVLSMSKSTQKPLQRLMTTPELAIWTE